MRRTEPRSAEIERPDGVRLSFQVSENNVEPSKSVLARNLLAKDDRGSALSDEPEPLGPEVSIVVEAPLLTCLGEWIAWTAPTPHVDVVGPPGVSQGSGPSSNSAEEVTLPVARDVGGPEVSDRSLIDDSFRDLSRGDQVARPLRGVRVAVVVERHRQRLLEEELARRRAKEPRPLLVALHLEREVATDHGLGRPRRGRQPASGQLDDLARVERARRDLAQDLGDDGERAHATPSTRRLRETTAATTRSVSIEDPASTWSLRTRASATQRSA